MRSPTGPTETSIASSPTRSSDADLAVVGLVVLEQRSERELEVVERLERDVVACRDAADDEPGDDREVGARAGS